MKDDFGEPVVKVGSEFGLSNLCFQIAIGGGENSDLGLDFSIAADASRAACFQKPQ
jgi:hypothetical protein